MGQTPSTKERRDRQARLTITITIGIEATPSQTVFSSIALHPGVTTAAAAAAPLYERRTGLLSIGLLALCHFHNTLLLSPEKFFVFFLLVYLLKRRSQAVAVSSRDFHCWGKMILLHKYWLDFELHLFFHLAWLAREGAFVNVEGFSSSRTMRLAKARTLAFLCVLYIRNLTRCMCITYIAESTTL